MNRFFFLRNPVGVVGAVAASFAFLLSACGDDSGSPSESKVNDFSLQVESIDDLPNCSKNRNGDVADVLGEKKVYVCDNGRWVPDHDIMDSVMSKDDLSACVSKKEGDSVWVVNEASVFVCNDRKWEKRKKEDETESSSSVAKNSSSSSVALLSSSAKVEKLSSSSTAKSSSSVKPGSSSAVPPISSSSAVIRSSSSVALSSSSYFSFFRSSSSITVVKGTLIDSRDNQSYKTVVIGSQTWMAENLKYGADDSYCYDNALYSCDEAGLFYSWAAAMDSVGKWSANGKGCGFGTTCSPKYPVRGVCPSGWHLPTKDEFDTLFVAVGGQAVAGKMLKSTSGWLNDGNGSDLYSFTALPAGYKFLGGEKNRYKGFLGEGYNAYFWTSTEYGDKTEHSDKYAYKLDLYCDTYNNADLSGFNKDGAMSVRCVKDE